LINAQAERAERINQIEAGEVIPADEAKAEWLDIVLAIKTRLAGDPRPCRRANNPGNPKIIATLEI